MTQFIEKTKESVESFSHFHEAFDAMELPDMDCLGAVVPVKTALKREKFDWESILVFNFGEESLESMYEN